MQYDCQIAGDTLASTITADRKLSSPVFCFSGMAPLAPISGGTLLRAVGSYTEVLLPDLAAGVPHRLVLQYADGFQPANRAWMPLGPYLRVGDDVIELPPTPAGRRGVAAAPVAAIAALPIVPQPQGWTPAAGTLTTDGFQFDDDALGAVADLARRQKLQFTGTTPVTIVARDMPEDAYSIDITPKGVTITAGSYGGRFYAGVSMLSLLQMGPLAYGTLSDRPRFGWRGQHLDTARHFYAPDTVFSLLDLMALLKLNRFHWHFADDEAFRIALDDLPELSQATALRGHGQLLAGMFNGKPTEGGTYSKQTVRAIVARAQELNIAVLPEIEAPAHALAITTLYPDTRDPDDTGTERSVQGYTGNVLNPAMPRTWEILSAIVAEIGPLFPFGMIHLGCDELPEETWMHSPKACALMAKHGLHTTKDLQGWTIAKLAGIAQDNGLRPAAWEEAAQGNQGGIGHGAVLFSWTGSEPGFAAARAGYDVVMTPAQHVYLDMAHTDDPDDWGASWAAFVDLDDTINWDPVPDPALTNRIVGIQGAFWSEFTTKDTQLWPMLMPRMLGVSAMAWEEAAPDKRQLRAMATRYAIDDGGVVSFRGV